jgi:hypothetical protein
MDSPTITLSSVYPLIQAPPKGECSGAPFPFAKMAQHQTIDGNQMTVKQQTTINNAGKVLASNHYYIV